MRNDQPILASLEPEVAERVASRRDALRSLGFAAAAVSFPVAFAASARTAFAQSGGLPDQVVEVLQFALTLERLEDTFYREALADKGRIPPGQRQVFETISAHETAHVQFLEKALGDEAGSAPEFDFTAGGAFDPQDYKTFLLLSQAFEDTGQRAYRGQAGELAGSPEILTAALTIHSVEARHAARVRRLRDLQGWVPNEQPDAPKPIAAVYAGMDETEKYGVDVPKVSTVEAKQVTESFDEPLTKDAVLDIVKPFLRS